MGVWIETTEGSAAFAWFLVTPCMGVWIETGVCLCVLYSIAASHPVWVCGLKLHRSNQRTPQHRHTLYGCVD